MKDYYEILGISHEATSEDIKKAYRRLAHKYHPDRAGGDERKFKEINEAYQILSDVKKREEYDRFGQVFQGRIPGFGGEWGGSFGGAPFNWDINFEGLENMGDLSDVFEAIFEGLGVREKRRAYKRGADLEFGVEITLEEAKAGKLVNLDYETLVACSECAGLGHFPKAGFSTCNYCSGRGEIKQTRKTFFGNFSQIIPCGNCVGSGQIPKKVCPVCKGVGRVKGKRGVKLEIRSGVVHGQIIKVKGMGETGERGQEAGDLYVRVNVKPHPIFQRQGNDLVRSVKVSVIDVLLGRKIKVETLDHRILQVQIPPSFNFKDELRLHGEGMTPEGDLVLRLEVKTPKHLSAKAKKLLEELEKNLENE